MVGSIAIGRVNQFIRRAADSARTSVQRVEQAYRELAIRGAGPIGPVPIPNKIDVHVPRHYRPAVVTNPMTLTDSRRNVHLLECSIGRLYAKAFPGRSHVTGMFR